MADQIREIYRKVRARSVDLRALLRLAVWGCAASAALMVAVLSAYSTMESPRTVTVAAPISTGNIQRSAPPTPAIMAELPPRPQEPVIAPAIAAELIARATDVENETRRLSEAVLALTADRNRLIERIASIERSLEDVSGSIKRQAAAPPAPAPPPSPESASRSAEPPVVSADPPVVLSLAASPHQLNPPPPEAAAPQPEAAAPPLPPEPPAALRVATPPATDSATVRSREFGVDVGGAVNFDGLRALWISTKRIKAMSSDRLYPIVAIRENRTRGVDLRLVVGPLPSTQAATQMCAELLAARRSCQMTTFEGQPLPLTAPEPERQPAAAPAAARNTSPARNAGQSGPARTQPARP